MPTKFQDLLLTLPSAKISEYTTYKISGFKKKQHFILAGTTFLEDLNNPGRDGMRAPRIHNLVSAQMALRQQIQILDNNIWQTKA